MRFTGRLGIGFLLLSALALVPSATTAQAPATDEKAEAVLRKAVEVLGGERYMQVKSVVGRGKFSAIREGVTASFQSFVDVIVYPDKERTEFKNGGSKSVQTNYGDKGWTFDGDSGLIGEQSERQVNDFRQAMNVSLENLLRGYWRGRAKLSYVGKRGEASPVYSLG